MNADTKAKPAGRDSVGKYKTMLLSVLDQRPSGTRQRLAHALGKNRSFVSQFSNPAYNTPIPSQHLDVIFDVCHFSQQEKAAFLHLYRIAHPGRVIGADARIKTRKLTIDLPDCGKASINRELDRLVAEFARSTARLLGAGLK